MTKNNYGFDWMDFSAALEANCAPKYLHFKNFVFSVWIENYFFIKNKFRSGFFLLLCLNVSPAQLNPWSISEWNMSLFIFSSKSWWDFFFKILLKNRLVLRQTRMTREQKLPHEQLVLWSSWGKLPILAQQNAWNCDAWFGLPHRNQSFPSLVFNNIAWEQF